MSVLGSSSRLKVRQRPSEASGDAADTLFEHHVCGTSNVLYHDARVTVQLHDSRVSPRCKWLFLPNWNRSEHVEHPRYCTIELARSTSVMPLILLHTRHPFFNDDD